MKFFEMNIINIINAYNNLIFNGILGIYMIIHLAPIKIKYLDF